ncbi:hypothetical protein C9374_012230 [Naegleria lovaniensis]|uniref:Fatty acid hydroxylase domain-containing protein n=1 Tax=Naegleria lovaniensis TaxID=51637 RepID=A0AA88GEZ5_NAELO|nr:uncharacterized protein C9374_012230 [Naegleria lovaniensis]KAG2373364.1 hypothetical protein C9374_012230 [Naegleria lovaniensis]
MLHFVVFILCDEVLFYVLHYAFHKVSFLYKHIHYFHHELRYTVSVGCEYAHPLEFLFGNVVPVLLGPVLMRTHLFWYWVWIAYKLLETSYVHSGFDFKLFGRLQFGTNEHAYHHSHYQDAYGAWYGLMDTMFRTTNHFKEYMKKKKVN